jgi:hypothetical protein
MLLTDELAEARSCAPARSSRPSASTVRKILPLEGEATDRCFRYGVTAPLAETLNVSTPLAEVLSEPPGITLTSWLPPLTVTDTV